MPTDPLAAAIANVRAKSAGRTRYAGQAPFHDELLVAEIDALRAAVVDILDELALVGWSANEWYARHHDPLNRAWAAAGRPLREAPDARRAPP